jgi:hypothetical protein
MHIGIENMTHQLHPPRAGMRAGLVIVGLRQMSRTSTASNRNTTTRCFPILPNHAPPEHHNQKIRASNGSHQQPWPRNAAAQGTVFWRIDEVVSDMLRDNISAVLGQATARASQSAKPPQKGVRRLYTARSHRFRPHFD